MTKDKCDHCGKIYNVEKHTWSAGYGCDYYCSKKCCNDAWDECGNGDYPYPDCPCY